MYLVLDSSGKNLPLYTICVLHLKMKVSLIMLLLAAIVATGATMTSAYAQQNGESMEAMEAMESMEAMEAPMPPSPFAPGSSVYFPQAMIGQITSNLPLPPFDMANGNAIFGVIIPNLGTWIHQEVSPHFADPSLSFRYVTLILNAGYDATAPYHETAVGV